MGGCNGFEETEKIMIDWMKRSNVKREGAIGGEEGKR